MHDEIFNMHADLTMVLSAFLKGLDVLCICFGSVSYIYIYICMYVCMYVYISSAFQLPNSYALRQYYFSRKQ